MISLSLAQQSKPLISIITVCYNSREALSKTINSVIIQKNIKFEYIVIDGESDDGTVDLINSYGSAISQWISEPDRGIYHAMNKGLSLATGSYVHFLNAGDVFLDNEVLSKAAEFLFKGPTLLMNQVISLDPLTGKRQILPKKFGLSNARDLFKSAYCHQAAFLRTDAYLQLGGFDESLPNFADFKTIYAVKNDPQFESIERPVPIVIFPLDGASSNWRRAPELYIEQERLLASLGAGATPSMRIVGLVQAYLYKIKLFLKINLLKTKWRFFIA